MMCVNNLTERLKKPFTMSACIIPSGVPLKDIIILLILAQ